MLLLFAGRAEPAARSQLVFVQTAMAQYGDKSLEAGVVAEQNDDLQYDWNFGNVKAVKAGELAREMAIRKIPSLLLISPEGKVAQGWQGFVPPVELGLTLKHCLGPANGNPMLDLNLPARHVIQTRSR
jgi:hypothetical protein